LRSYDVIALVFERNHFAKSFECERHSTVTGPLQRFPNVMLVPVRKFVDAVQNSVV
jgi:hypothetical protein